MPINLKDLFLNREQTQLAVIPGQDGAVAAAAINPDEPGGPSLAEMQEAAAARKARTHSRKGHLFFVLYVLYGLTIDGILKLRFVQFIVVLTSYQHSFFYLKQCEYNKNPIQAILRCVRSTTAATFGASSMAGLSKQSTTPQPRYLQNVVAHCLCLMLKAHSNQVMARKNATSSSITSPNSPLPCGKLALYGRLRTKLRFMAALCLMLHGWR